MKKQGKVILFIIICIFIATLATLIWANQTGRISIWANPPAPLIVGKPVCKTLYSLMSPGSVTGWYDSGVSTGNSLIKKDDPNDPCSNYTAQCLGSTNMSRGWYKVSNSDPSYKVLIGYANCTLTTPTPAPTQTTVTKSCVDTDGGIVPQVFGTVTTKNGTLTDTQSDRCVENGTALEEAYCQSSTSSAVGFRKIYGTCQGGKIVSASTPTTTALNCIDECVSGNLVCTSSTSYQLCGNYDSDPCLEYKNLTCPADKICQNNTIIAKPTPTPTSAPTVNPSPTSTIQTPSIPINLKATNITSDNVDLTWDAVATAIRYGIYNAKTVTWIDTVNTNSYKLSGLKCETDYSFHVTAINDQGYGSNPSNTVNLKTSQCQDIVSDINTKKPENTQIEYDGINIKISWSAVDGANGYDIYNCSKDYVVSTDQTTYTFTSSNCGNEYCYYVVAHDSAGKESQISNQMKVVSDPCVTSVTVADEDKPSIPITSLVSTGASLWFNLLVGVLLALGIGYFMFRQEINNK